jgi:para-nitrobenzyl esterase
MLLAQLGINKSRFRELQDIPVDLIEGAQAASHAPFGPFVDGTVIPRDPFDPDAPAISSDVPLLAGSNLNDSNFTRTDFSIDDAAAQAQLKTSFGVDPTPIWSAYRAEDPKATAAQLLGRITSDRGIRANTRMIAERKAALGHAPAFLYQLRWPAPFMGGQYGSVHGTDLSMIFHNTEAWPLTAGSSASGAIADQMAAAFAAFAKTGSPGTPELAWPAFSPASKPTMLFDVQSGVKNDPDHDLLAMLPPPSPRGMGF